MATSYSDGIFYRNNLRINPFLISCTSSLTPGIVIDFGSGIGTNSFYLKEKGWDVFVLEKEPIAIAELKKIFPPERIFKADIISLDFSALPISELIICNYVLQHLNISDAENFIVKALSKVRKNGHAVFSIFERDDAIDFHCLKQVFESNGATLLEKKEWLRWDYDHGPAHFHKGVESFWQKTEGGKNKCW